MKKHRVLLFILNFIIAVNLRAVCWGQPASDAHSTTPCDDSSELGALPLHLADEAESIVRKIRFKKPSHSAFVEAVNSLAPGEKTIRKALANKQIEKVVYPDYYSYNLAVLREVESRAEAENQPKDWAPLSPDEVLALRIYTSEDYEVINQLLEKQDPNAMAFADMASAALSRLPKFVGKVSRGEYLGEKGSALMQPGKFVTYTGFVSASRGSAFDRPYRLTIHSQSGRSIEHFSITEDELEVLFVPGTVFEVLERFRSVDSLAEDIVLREIPRPDVPSEKIPWE